MVSAGEERRTTLPPNTKVKKKKKAIDGLLVLLMLMYPTLLGFVFAARLATFSLLIPTPTVPGTPVLPDAGKPDLDGAPPPPDAGNRLHGTGDRWETGGVGAVVRSISALVSITVVHLFLVCYLVRGPSGAYLMDTSDGRSWAFGVSTAFWCITTCFLLTYTSMARYGAHDLEWIFAGGLSMLIFFITLQAFMSLPSLDEKVVVHGPTTDIV